MRKIQSLFERNYDGDRLVNSNIVPGSEWVVNGEGVATRKFDGTCCMVKDGVLYKRYDAKRGKTPPEGFIPAQAFDTVTGHMPGWLEVKNGEPSDKWHLEAWDACGRSLENGTYELCGPKIQSNPEDFGANVFIKHGSEVIRNVPVEYEALKAWLVDKDIEGIVWHHEDGRMVKIKKKDFGLKR